ncbi:related to Protein MAK11 [Saccharomycodes ludwigii]|uniref:Related to Protein MAK11 n=1 Tax=Saccharomycodes ludwigii TaxID=36035 RepID=A0A376B282_9ASCO|nr:hypothetical protein SCDLUD_003071 [Saccharomycodes ludwigii]KAH3900104.1 hypothetical protein SCDLUD_003071 [Saccharomycodes ludwigii]SSD58719.1 related to Protein MAK11 [Saccharomycodes ludwigii]
MSLSQEKNSSSAANTGKNQFRIIVGSYEHNILCVSLDLSLSEPLFSAIFHFQAHALSVKCLASCKRYLVSGSNDEHIRIYDLQKRKELGTLLSHQGSITALKFSGETVNFETKESDPRSKGKWLLSASEDKTISIWRVKDWEKFGVLKGHTARINDIDIHPSNRIAISVSDDHTIRLWNLMTIKKAGILKLRKYNQNGQFVRWCGENSEFFVVALTNLILFYKTSDAKVFHEIELSAGKTIMHLEVVKIEGVEYVVVALNDGNVSFFNTNFLKEETAQKQLDEEELDDINDFQGTKADFSLLGHSNRVKDFKIYENPFGLYLVTIGSDGRIVVWNLHSRDQIAVYDCGERLNCLSLISEDVEKFDSMKKRTLTEADLEGEQSEVEADPEELKKIMLGGKNKRKKKGSMGKKAKKVTVELE